MTTATVKFTLSQIGQRAAIAAGQNAEQTQSSQVEITPDILPALTIAPDGSASYDATTMALPDKSYRTSRAFDAPPSAEQLTASIRNDIAAACAYTTHRADEQAANFAAYDAAIATPDVREKYLRECATGGYPHHALPGHNDDRQQWDKLHRPDFAAEISEMRARLDANRLANEAGAKQRDAEKAAVKQAGLDALRGWALANGSKRLRMILEMQIGDWQAVAEDEFFTANTPVGYNSDQWQRSDDCDDRRKPTEPELVEFAALKKLVEESKGTLKDPRLQYHTIEAHENDDGEQIEAEHYTATDVEVVAPTGRTLMVAKIIE